MNNYLSVRILTELYTKVGGKMTNEMAVVNIHMTMAILLKANGKMIT